MSIAMSGYFGLKQETSYGVEATPNVFMEFSSESIDMDNNLIMPEYIGGQVGRKRILAGNITDEGDIVTDMMPEGCMGWLLKGIFGQVTTTALGGGVFSHLFTPRLGLALPSYTIDVNRLGGRLRHIGARLGNLAVRLTPTELLNMTMQVICQRQKEAGAQTPSYSTLDPFVPRDISVLWNDVADTNFEDLNINVTNGLISVPTLNNQRYNGKVSATTFDANGDFTIEFDSMAMVRQMWGANAATEPQACLEAQKLNINIESGCQEIGSTGTYYQLNWEFPEVFLSYAKAPLTGATARVVLDVAWHARHSISAGYAFKATLINSESGYPDP